MIAVVSAWKPEIEFLLQQKTFEWTAVNSRTWKGRTPAGEMLIASTLGVGYLEAGIRTVQLLHQYEGISHVLFTGTAGLYPGNSRLNIGDLVSCESVILADPGVAEGHSTFAEPLKKDFLHASQQPLPELLTAKVATLIALTLAESLTAKLSLYHGCELEHMELYGMALACAQANIPWNAVLGITNAVGPEGSLLWKKNHQKLEHKSGEFLMEYLSG